ncbi:hypothetical protein CAEBREN_19516 [Caenorhabditis brenneri]|uniref:Uncharacterized protein n=1 Tax=Caenorhabditis brenneri TaxID=135651 RepID=G0NJ05_CAEBE|nr:hypothetical protein CAEBREN_19516 [Caenorhabditis brenneri]
MAKALFLTLFVLVAAASAQNTGPGTPADCSTLECPTPAGCAMVRPLVCTIPVDNKCPTVPKCVKDNVCMYSRCTTGFQCVLKEVWSEEDPVASCEPY